MRLLDAYSKDVHGVIEHRREDLQKLFLFLDNSKVEFNDNTPELKEACDYIKNEFYPQLKEMIESLKGL